MRSKIVVLAALTATAAGSLMASQAADPNRAATAAKADLVEVGGLKWVEIPNTPAKMATVKGDSAKGAHASFVKLPAGFSAPLHFHTADHHVTVVSGTAVLTPKGATAKKLAAGSWFEFTGKMQHTTSCEAGADCVLFVVGQGAWDLVPEEAPKK